MLIDKFPDLIDRKSPIPVYQQIATSIKARITQEEWIIGEKLPSENELAKEYDVSRVTIRQALSQLDKDSIIQKIQGKGIFVDAKPHFTVQELRLPQVNPDPTPSSVKSRDISIVVLDEPNKRAARHLKLGLDVPQVYLERLFEKDGHVVGINRAWFPKERVPGLPQSKLVNNSISTTLIQKYNYEINKVEIYIEAINLDAQTATILDSVYAAPGLVIDTVYFIEDKIPIEYSSTIWDANDTQFHLMLSSTN